MIPFRLLGFLNPSFSSRSFLIPFFGRRNSNNVYVQSLNEYYYIEEFCLYDVDNFQEDAILSIEIPLYKRAGDYGLLAVLLGENDLVYGSKAELEIALATRVDAICASPFLRLEVARFLNDSDRVVGALQAAAEQFSTRAVSESWLVREKAAWQTERLNRSQIAARDIHPNETTSDILNQAPQEILHWLERADFSDPLWAAAWLLAHSKLRDDLKVVRLGLSWTAEYAVSGKSKLWRPVWSAVIRHPESIGLLKRFAHLAVHNELRSDHRRLVWNFVAQHLDDKEVYDLCFMMLERDTPSSRSEMRYWLRVFQMMIRHSKDNFRVHAIGLDKLTRRKLAPSGWVRVWQLLLESGTDIDTLLQLGRDWINEHFTRGSVGLRAHDFPTNTWATIWELLLKRYTDKEFLAETALAFLGAANPNSSGWARVCANVLTDFPGYRDRVAEQAIGWLHGHHIKSWPKVWFAISELHRNDPRVQEAGTHWLKSHRKDSNAHLVEQTLSTFG